MFNTNLSNKPFPFSEGNKKIHYLTSNGNNIFNINLDLYTNVKKVWYTYFQVGDTESKYQLTIDGYKVFQQDKTVKGMRMSYV